MSLLETDGAKAMLLLFLYKNVDREGEATESGMADSD